MLRQFLLIGVILIWCSLLYKSVNKKIVKYLKYSYLCQIWSCSRICNMLPMTLLCSWLYRPNQGRPHCTCSDVYLPSVSVESSQWPLSPFRHFPSSACSRYIFARNLIATWSSPSSLQHRDSAQGPLRAPRCCLMGTITIFLTLQGALPQCLIYFDFATVAVEII